MHKRVDQAFYKLLGMSQRSS